MITIQRRDPIARRLRNKHSYVMVTNIHSNKLNNPVPLLWSDTHWLKTIFTSFAISVSAPSIVWPLLLLPALPNESLYSLKAFSSNSRQHLGAPLQYHL
mmetsp:Transcript_23221/g.43104  ORF Transcript_23221/g.43104 Transcript_23221/m.43104 type:complete len:99 (+) Transcript_23221:999-1295(+)